MLGFHTHILEGIEVYKGKTIFYSLGNFVLKLGARMKDYAHVSSLDLHYKIKERYDRRKTLIAKAIIEDRNISRISYIPCCENDNKEPEIVMRNDARGNQITTEVYSKKRLIQKVKTGTKKREIGIYEHATYSKKHY
jgi:poly-gamma-glutamate capsule biosynthesis protein CapA/YwtB (metallophosphatase superfamily)